jgi:hypothetical protein
MHEVVLDLDLRPDGVFRETVRRGGVVAAKYTGHWESGDLGPSGWPTYAHLAPYHFDWPVGIPGSGQTGEWLPMVKRINGKVSLIINEDIGLYCVHE